jgi:serine phosphatase RsbU (regulator of sigma subunit)/putative methionine-R-sulfoxide reductase with GAF domain
VTSPPGDRLRLLFELGCAFTARIELEELIPFIITKCREVLGAGGAAVLLLDPDRNELVFPYVAEEDPLVAARLAGMRLPAGEGIAGAVLRDGRPLRVDDPAADPRFYSGVDRQTGVTTRGILAAPLTSRHGTIGVIEVVNRRDGGNFTDDDLAFLEALAGSVAVAIENARLYAQLKQQFVALQEGTRDREQLLAIRRELDIARDIQQSFLPRIFPRRPDFDVFAQMIPAREVGGDFYDFFLVDDTRLGVVVGDVSGKGIPAALFMAVSRSLLKSVALAGSPPGECLRRVNALLCLDNSAELFVTVFYGVLDTRTGELEYSNGGHNPPYVVRGEGDVHPLEGTGGIVLGVFDDIQYRAKRAALRPGDGVFLYTDGVTEAMDAEGNLFSDPRLQALLAQHGRASSEAITRAVVDEVRRYSASVPQSDDITTMAIRYRG